MPELRRDPIIGRWVIVATERARRPGNFIGPEDSHGPEEPCPFCSGKESKTIPEVYAIRPWGSQPNTPNWNVRVIPSKNPLFGIEGDLRRRGQGLYDIMRGVGAHEVVVETPQHVANMADLDIAQIERVIKVYAARVVDLQRDPRFKYIFIFKKYGVSAGANNIRHARSHIIATPVTPEMVKEKLIGAKKYFDYHERCIYCDLITQEIEDGGRVISEHKNFVVVTPFAPRYSFEILILPKKHCCDFASGVAGFERDLAVVLKEIFSKIKYGLDDAAYNMVIHTAPFRGKAEKTGHWQTIEEDYHWHIEIVPRLTYLAGFEKGSGFHICSIPPEYTADFLQKVPIVRDKPHEE